MVSSKMVSKILAFPEYLTLTMAGLHAAFVLRSMAKSLPAIAVLRSTMCSSLPHKGRSAIVALSYNVFDDLFQSSTMVFISWIQKLESSYMEPARMAKRNLPAKVSYASRHSSTVIKSRPSMIAIRPLEISIQFSWHW